MTIQTIADVIGNACTPEVDSVQNPNLADIFERLAILYRQNPDHIGLVYCEPNLQTISFTVNLKKSNSKP